MTFRSTLQAGPVGELILADAIEREPSRRTAPAKAPRDETREPSDVWQWLGLNGGGLGTSGVLRATFRWSCIAAAALVAVVNSINVITDVHEWPQSGILPPVIAEGSSWITLLAFFWIPWVGYRLAPPTARPRWRLLIHLPTALLFSFAHVAGFYALRKLIYWLAGANYDFGSFYRHFFGYEFRKDALGYCLFIAGFALIEHLLRQQRLIETPGQSLTLDIRDGAKLVRVRLDEVLAIASAGNYAEFHLRDGRALLMRSSLAALENDLSTRGFLRTHRSWLVNAARLTELKPEGSGDYTIRLGSLTAPLSRRFPEALAKLRCGCRGNES